MALSTLVKFDRGLFRNGNTAKGLNYGQIEPNQVWFDRAGMVEAQCRLDKAWFADEQVAPLTVAVKNTAAAGQPSNGTPIVAQVGAFLEVNKATYTATVPTYNGFVAKNPVGINYSTERIYDDTAKQRRKFFLTTQDWLPRIGYVEKGMRITTNTVQWNAVDGTSFDGLDLSTYTTANAANSYAVFNAIKAFIADPTNGPLYAAVLEGSDGELVINVNPEADTTSATTTANTTPIILAQVVAAYDNADRTCSFMFQIVDGGTK